MGFKCWFFDYQLVETAKIPLHAKFVLNYIGQEVMLPFQPSIPSLPDFPFQIWAKIAANVYRNIHKLHLGYDSAQGFLPLREAADRLPED